jgi:hypothetical protein
MGLELAGKIEELFEEFTGYMACGSSAAVCTDCGGCKKLRLFCAESK